MSKERPTESSTTDTMQKPVKLLLDFIVHVQISLERKLHPRGLKDQFTKLGRYGY